MTRILLACLVLAFAADERIRRPVTVETLSEWLASHPDATLSDTLRALPDEMKTSAVWIFESESKQLASKPRPRGVAYDFEGGLTLAFSGRPDDPARNTLELLQFRKDTARFELYAIDFDRKPPKTSDKNPGRCTKCHGEDPRPNWNHYPNWPGVYGPKHHASGDVTWNDFLDFTKAAGKEPPYATFRPHARTEGQIPESNALSDPNSRLTDAFGAQNSARLARLIRSTGYGDALLPTVAALALDCEIAPLFPDAWRAIARALQTLREATRLEEGLFTTKYFFELLGENTRDWSMTFDRTQPRFALPSREDQALTGALLPFSADLREVFQLYPSSRYRTVLAEPKVGRITACEKLTPLSQAALKQLAPPKMPAPKGRTPPADHR